MYNFEKSLIRLGDKVRVSDPCYDDDVWCKTKLKNVLPGNYDVEVGFEDATNRIAYICVIHQDYLRKRLDWNMYDNIGVDSGQAGIFCESTYRNDDIKIDTPDCDFNLSVHKEGDIWYENMCKFTLSDAQWGVYDSGVVTTSGYGDGSYPLEIAKENNGFIVGIKITFIVENYYEEEF